MGAQVLPELKLVDELMRLTHQLRLSTEERELVTPHLETLKNAALLQKCEAALMALQMMLQFKRDAYLQSVA